MSKPIQILVKRITGKSVAMHIPTAGGEINGNELIKQITYQLSLIPKLEQNEKQVYTNLENIVIIQNKNGSAIPIISTNSYKLTGNDEFMVKYQKRAESNIDTPILPAELITYLNGYNEIIIGSYLHTDKGIDDAEKQQRRKTCQNILSGQDKKESYQVALIDPNFDPNLNPNPSLQIAHVLKQQNPTAHAVEKLILFHSDDGEKPINVLETTITQTTDKKPKVRIAYIMTNIEKSDKEQLNNARWYSED